MDRPLGTTLGNLGPNSLIALVEEEIVTNVHNVSSTKHLNHVYLYATAGRLLFNFLEYGATQSLNKRLCPGNDICRASGRVAMEFSPEQTP